MSTSVEEARAALRARMGGKVQNRHGLSRKQVSVYRESASTGPDNSEKVRATIQRMGGNALVGGDVVFFKKDGGQVMHFSHPKVTIAPSANAAFIGGNWVEKPEDEFNTDKQILELIQRFSQTNMANAANAAAPPTEVPELIPEDFEKEAEEPAADQQQKEEVKADALD